MGTKRKRVIVMNEVSGKLSKRNLIPEDLTGLQLKAMLGDPQTTIHALTAFIEKARRLPMPGVYDLVEGYLKVSTDCTEIFKLLQGERLPDHELTLVWQTLENLLLRLAGDLYHMSAAGQSITRNLCFGHMKALYNSLSSKNIKLTSVHEKLEGEHSVECKTSAANTAGSLNCVRACLRLLTAMVMQGTDCARDLLSHFDFNHRSLMVLPKQHDPKVKEDVRMVFVKFVLAFLLSGDASIISQTLAVKGLVADLLKTGLRQDRLSTVHLMLSTLRSRVLKNVAINKTQKLSLFTPGVLAQLATLYSWNGIDDVTDIQDIEAQNDAGKVLVREQVHAFLMELCCSSKFGIGFHDPNFGTYGRVGNITLLRFLVAMHGIADDALKCELVIRVLRAFPDLLARFLSQCNLSFVPRQSSAWLHNMQLLRKIYEAQPVLSKALQSCHSIPIPRLVSMVLVTTVPPVLDRSTVSRGLMNPHVTVRQATLGLLLFVLRRLQNNMRWSQTEWLRLDLRSEAETLEFLTIFRDSLGKMLPDMTTIISTWHRASTQVEIASTTAQVETTTRGDAKHVRDPQQVLIQSMILEVLLLYQHLIPHVVAQSSFDFTKLLQSIVGDDGKAHPLVQRRVLDLLLALPTGKFSWFRTRSSVSTQVPEEGEGKQSEHSMFLLVLQMFVTTEETQLRCSSQNLLLKVLDESGLFNFASHELHIWLQELLHVPLEGRNCVLILLERALCRLLTKPHVYTDLVAKWIRDAAVLQASLAVPELESGSVSISNIDEALDVVDVLMDSNEDLNDELEGPLDPMQLAASFPFSALVPATLYTWNHIAQSCSTTLGPMCEYLVSVLVCILHLQLEPLPLCLALQHQDEQFAGLVSEGCAGQRKADNSDACLSRLAGFHVYYSSWIPPQARLEPFSGIAAIPLIGKESEAGKSGELWHRLCAAYSRGEACFLEPDVQLSLKEAAAAAPRADLRPAIFHVLLYLRTCVDGFGQHKRAVGKALLSFYLELLQTFLEVSRISKEEAETTEPRNSLKVSEDDADNDMCTLMGIQSRDENDGEGAGIKNEAEAQSAMDLARAILEHPILDSWFLAAELGRFPAHSLRPSALHLVSKTLSLGAAELVRSAALLGAGGLLQVQWYTKRALVACEREVAGTADTPSLAHSSSALRCLSTLYDCTGAAQRAEVLHLLLGLPKHLLVFTLEEFEPTTLTVYGKALLAMVTGARLEELQVLSCNELAQLVEMLSYSPDADAESLLDALTRLVCEVTLWADLLPHTLVSLCLSLNTPSALRLTAELVRHSAAHCYAWEQWLLSHGAVRRLRQQLSVCWLIVSAHLDALEKHGVSLVGDHRVLNRLWKVLSPVLTRALSVTEDQTSGSEDQAVIDQEATQIALISRLLHIRPPPSWDRLLYKLPCLLQNPKQAFWWALVDGEMNREPVMNPTLRDDLAVAGLTAILASLGLGPASRGHITSIAPRLLRLLDDGAKISAAVWNKFLKSALKFGLTDGPLLALLNSTMRRVYVAPPRGLMSFTKIHALLCSHSMFVSTLLTVGRNEMNTCGNVDLQQRMDVKRELVKLLLFVIEKEPSVCQSEHFPVLLGAYRATLDSVDCQLLFLLQFYENHDVRLSNLRMLLWGEAVTEQRQKRETLGFTLWQEPSSRHVLSLLQHDRMLNTALRFPLKRRLMPPVSSEEFSVEVFGEESENIYDPCFLLPLFSTLAAPGSDLDCHYFTSMNGLAVVLAALASYDPTMRSAAYHVLAAFYVQLEGARFREKAELLYLVEFIRGGIYKANACLSFLVVIFFAKTASVLLRPEDPMYLHLNRFMFSHEFLDTKKVPAFYKFFFSSQAEYAGQTTEREWALSVLEVGLRDRTCVELCARQHIFILLLAYAGGPLADAASQELVFKVLINAARIPSGAYRLVQDHGVLCWLVGLLKRHLKEHKVLDRALELLKTLWKTNLGKKGTEDIKSESDGEQGGSEPKYAAQAVPEGLEAGYAEDEDEDEEKKEKVDDAPAAQEAGRSRQTSRTGPTHPIKCLPMQMINEFVLVQHTFLKQDSMCRDVQSFCCLSRLLASMLSHRCVAMAAADKAGKVLANRSGLCHADMLYLLGTWARLACPGPARDALKRKDVCHGVHDDAGVRQPQSKSGKTRERHRQHGTSLQAKASPLSSAAEATQESRLHLLRILCCWLPQEELRNAEDGRETVSDTMKLCLEWLFADDTCFSLSSSDLLHLLRWLRNCAMSFAPLHTFAGTIATGLLRLIDEASAGNGNGRSWTAGTVSELQKEAQGLSESLLELLQRRTCDSKGNVMCVRSRCILDKVVMRFLVPAARDFDHPHLQAAASSLVSLFQHEMWLSDDSPNLFLWLLGRMAEQDYTACNPELFNNIFSALAKIRKRNKLITT